MKRLQPIPANVLKTHHENYYSGIQQALDRLAAGKRVEISKSSEAEETVLMEEQVLADSGVVQYFQAIRDLFVDYSLLTATANSLRDVVNNHIPPLSSCGAKEVVIHMLMKVFNYSKFQRGRALIYENNEFVWRKNKPDWGAFEFLKHHLNSLKFCPYCNASDIYAINKDDDKSTKVGSSLDHFYPQKKYPFLALSLYNLIPVCFRCNTQMKGSSDMKGVANPYIEDIHRKVVFFPVFENSTPLLECPCKLLLVPRKQHDSRVTTFVRLFALENLYSTSYEEIARCYVKKAKRYTPEYRRQMANFYRLASPRDFEKDIFGMMLEESEINKTFLGKMKLDIVERFQMKTGSDLFDVL